MVLARNVIPFGFAMGITACAAPLGDAHPCSPTTCGQGRVCVVGRCYAVEASPAPSDTLRRVLVPQDVAVLAARGGGWGAPLSETIALGRAGSGSVVMLFRFAPSWSEEAEIVSALLVLEPVEGAPLSAGPIAFEVARILEPWQSSEVSWGRQPKLDLPRRAGSVLARPGLPMRIDISPIVRTWTRHTADDHGIALLADGDDAYGVVISMGLSYGRGPRLEVYLK